MAQDPDLSCVVGAQRAAQVKPPLLAHLLDVQNGKNTVTGLYVIHKFRPRLASACGAARRRDGVEVWSSLTRASRELRRCRCSSIIHPLMINMRFEGNCSRNTRRPHRVEP